MELTGRGDVGVAVDDLPLAVLAAIDMGDPQGNRRDRAAVHGEGGVLVADGVGQVPAGPGGHQLQAEVGAVGEPGRQPAEGLARLLAPMASFMAPNTVTGSWVDQIARRGSGSPLVSALSASTWRARVGVRKSSSSLMATSRCCGPAGERGERRPGPSWSEAPRHGEHRCCWQVNCTDGYGPARRRQPNTQVPGRPRPGEPAALAASREGGAAAMAAKSSQQPIGSTSGNPGGRYGEPPH